MPSPSADSSLSTSQEDTVPVPGARSLTPEGQLGGACQRKACRARLCRPEGRSRPCRAARSPDPGARHGLNLQPPRAVQDHSTRLHGEDGGTGQPRGPESGTATCRRTWRWRGSRVGITRGHTGLVGSPLSILSPGACACFLRTGSEGSRRVALSDQWLRTSPFPADWVAFIFKA